MEAMLQQLLQAVLTVAIPIISGFLVNWLNAKAGQAKAAVKNETAGRIIEDTMAALTGAVQCTQQTYVDALKKAGTWTPEAQKEAFRLTMEAAKASLSKDAAEFLQTAYGDLDAYLAVKIEAIIKELKPANALPAA